MKRSRINPVSKDPRKVARQEEYRRARNQYMAEHPKCEYPKCKHWATDLHHKAGRSGPLLCDPNYFAALCRPHHDVVDQNRAAAEEIGMFIRIR